MDRRNFVKSVSTIAALSSLPSINSFAEEKAKSTNKIIKPPKLKKGDTIGLIAPASFIREDELKESVENLEALGFKVKYTNRILARDGYLGGTDKQRTEDVNEMFSRDDIDGIVCARGGYGSARILPMLNYDLIKKNPKILVGYSDITALLYGIFAQTGLVCFHGPVGISTFNDFSVFDFENVLMEPLEKFTMYSAPEKNGDESLPVTIRTGKAAGKLCGGNLSIVVSMIGTPYDIDTDGKIVFLEEVGEDPYRIDRMLTQMREAGKFENAAGIALGIFSKCDAKKNSKGETNSFSLSEVLYDRLYDLNIPVLYGMSFGHITNKFTLPFGIEAELNSGEQTLTLLEPAVL